MTAPPSQELVAGKYRLTRLLGQGGMGSVWEGVHSSLGTRVAIKFIDAEYADSQEARSRFVNEARAAARLQSKHVVKVYDQGVTDDGRPYIVMEFLGGEPLDQRLSRLGRISMAETAHVILHVSRALRRAHDAGIVHRDLKPENVFLVKDDEDGTEIAKVVDFGIAKFTDSSNIGVSSATRTGSVLGTPYYMSPEQARGLRNVDHRSDLWSLGVIAYRCVTGRLPFEGEAVGDLLVKICTSPIPVPSEVLPGTSPAFDQWFARALAREPEARFQSAEELAQALGAAVGQGGREPMVSVVNDYASAPTHAAPMAPTPLSTTPMSTPGSAPLLPAAAQTEAAFTHNAIPTKKSPPIALFVGVGLGVLLLAAGGLALALSLGGPATPEAGAEALPSASVAAAVPDVPPAVEPSAEPAAPPSASAPEPTPTSEPPKLAAAPKAAPKPVAKPAPAPKPAAAPAPSPKPKPPKGVDLGY